MWAVFQDRRGVLHCEKVNEGIECWTLVIPARPERKNWFGMVTQTAREEEILLKAVFLESHYSREEYTAAAFEAAPEGYTLNPNMAYMKNNRWGPIEFILAIEDDKLGKRLHTGLKHFEPVFGDEGPRPGNDRLVELIHEIAGL